MIWTTNSRIASICRVNAGQRLARSMLECDVEASDCAEVLVTTVPAGEAQMGGQILHELSSFQTLVDTALAQGKNPQAEHSYAVSDEKMYLDGKEKDHNYSTSSKMMHRKAQSLSEEDISLSADFSFPRDSPLYLPHYQSNDSALDVTGFDSISRKCLSYENIDVKTVDVFTDTCILPGTSYPDISKMTLQSKDVQEMQTSMSLPNTPPFLDYRTKCDHTYSSSSNEQTRDKGSKCGNPGVNMATDGLAEQDPLYRSPLFDHSYMYNSRKHTGIPKLTGMKRGRSIDEIDNVSKLEFTKLPFLDNTYQSLVWQAAAYRHCTVLKKGRMYAQSLQKIHVDNEKPALQSETPPFLDHNYETLDSSLRPELARTRSRSASLSEPVPVKFGELSLDHSYVMDSKSDDDLSDSGTESYNGDGDEEMSTIFGSLVTLQKDHPYITKKYGL